MLSPGVPVLRWMLDLRCRRVHLAVAVSIAALASAAWLPDRLPTVVRDAQADPWTIAWCLPALATISVLSPRTDHMETSLPTMLANRRLVAVMTHVVLALALVLVAGWATDRGSGPPAVAFAWCLALVLVSAVVAGQLAAMVVSSSAVLINWVFGVDEITGDVHGWAILMRSPELPLSAAAALALTVSVGVWCWRGTRADR